MEPVWTRNDEGAPASVATSQPRLSPLIGRRNCQATRGLGIAGPPAINERPHAIGGPLERSLRSRDNRFRRLGSTTVVVSIRRRIGKRYFVQHRWYSRECGAAVPWLRHPIGTGKAHGEGHISSSTSTTIHSIYNRPRFRVCSRLHNCEITLDTSQPGPDSCFTIITKSVRE